MTEKSYFYKYKKYKNKYLSFINQNGGNFSVLHQYLLEATEIFKNVDEFGEKDGIDFFITGSVAFLFYFIDFYIKNKDHLNDKELKGFNDVALIISPQDLDIFWAEPYGSSYDLFYTEITNFIEEKMKRKIDIRIGEEVRESVPVLAPPLSPPPIFTPMSLPLSEPSLKPPLPVLSLFSLSEDVLKNKENLTCEGNDELFIIGSHYTKVPIPVNPTFYKCADKPSKYIKIDFDKLKTNVKCTNIIYDGTIVRILGINDLLFSYKSSNRDKDRIKIAVLEFICSKLGESNEYVGNPLFS